MIGWIKKLFGMSDANVSSVETKAVEPAPVKPKAPSEPKKAKASPAKKTAKKTTKKKSDTPNLSAMTKTELDIYGRKIGLKLDRRRTKDFMMKEIENHIKEK